MPAMWGGTGATGILISIRRETQRFNASARISYRRAKMSESPPTGNLGTVNST